MHFDGRPDAQGSHCDERVTEVGAHPHFIHFVDIEGITIFGDDIDAVFSFLQKPPEEGIHALGSGVLRARVELGRADAVVVAALQQDDDYHCLEEKKNLSHGKGKDEKNVTKKGYLLANLNIIEKYQTRKYAEGLGWVLPSFYLFCCCY